MLKYLLGKVARRESRYYTEAEIRELVSAKEFDRALGAIALLHPATPDSDLTGSCLRAEIAFRTHRDSDAEALYREVLKQAPGFLDAHYGISLLKHAQGDFDTAFQHALFSSNGAPANPRYLGQLGLCHICTGSYGPAEELLRRSLQYAPGDKSSWNNLGIALLAKGRASEARICFGNALNLDPGFAEAQKNLERLAAETAEHFASDTTRANNIDDAALLLDGEENARQSLLPSAADSAHWHELWLKALSLAQRGAPNDAFIAAEDLLLRYPDAAELSVLVSRLYRIYGEADSGLTVLQAFLVRHPTNAVAHQGIGEAYLFAPDCRAAEKHLELALELGPRTEVLLKTLAKTLMKQDRYADALAIYKECQMQWPSAINRAHLAIAHHHNCDYAEALEHFEALQHDDLIVKFDIQAVYAHCLSYAGRVDEALTILDAHIAKHGEVGQVRLVRAALQLLMQDFGHGWDGYRYRQIGLSNYRVLPVPQWQGEPLEGKTIVVLAEQGLGDQVMFASCLPDLLALHPARVIVETISRVTATIARSFPQCEVIASRQDAKLDWLRDFPNVDCFVPLGELPRHFRRSLESFPGKPYLLPDPIRVKFWRSRLEALGPGPYIGTSWRGGTEATRKAIRTLSPALLLPLTQSVKAQWVSLQYGNVTDELAKALEAGVHLTHWPDGVSDLDEFAALIAALDGVVTVCNTTVHYAGAVGIRTWVLAPTVPEWRYGLHNRHMPWYPHVEVLRQPFPHAWPELITVVQQHLLTFFDTAKSGK